MDRLYDTPAWVLGIVLLVSMGVALEAGHRLSRHERAPSLAPIQGAILGLVALLLAFSFSAAESRFIARRRLVVTEANDIGTMYLRAGLLTSPIREQMRSRLRRYVDVRLAIFDAARDPTRLPPLLEETDRIHAELWTLLEEATPKASFPIVQVTVTSLNQVIDVSAERKDAATSRIPDSILIVLFIATIGGALLVAYQPQDEKRQWVLWTTFAVLLTLVMVTLIDLDRPRRGLIQTSQEPLIDLRETLKTWPLSGPP